MSKYELVWRKSSRCESSACVEVALTGQNVVVRDSKNCAGPILTFSRDQWSAFVNGVRAGEFETQ